MFNSLNLFRRQDAGFTLIELLVVIAILAVLATAVVVVLNPAELMKQGRDSTRLSDLAAVNSALALYLADIASPSVGSASYCTSGTSTKGTTACTATTTLAVTGGWVSVDLTGISSGAPLSAYPLDPNNGSTNCGSSAAACFYQYIPSSASSTYELDAAFESSKYANGGGSDNESTDGGTNANAYETGNDPGLDL